METKDRVYRGKHCLKNIKKVFIKKFPEKAVRRNIQKSKTLRISESQMFLQMLLLSAMKTTTETNQNHLESANLQSQLLPNKKRIGKAPVLMFHALLCLKNILKTNIRMNLETKIKTEIEETANSERLLSNTIKVIVSVTVHQKDLLTNLLKKNWNTSQNLKWKAGMNPKWTVSLKTNWKAGPNEKWKAGLKKERVLKKVNLKE